jgi:hypothetical protein
MSEAAVSLLIYVWHYLVGRMIYDQLLRPIGRGDAAAVLLLACVAAAAFALGRCTRRRA